MFWCGGRGFEPGITGFPRLFRLGESEQYVRIHISCYESAAEMIINTRSHRCHYLMADMKGYGVYLFAISAYYILST